MLADDRNMQRKLHLVLRQRQGVSPASLGKATLSIWQSAVLAYASAKGGTAFTTIEQTQDWLHANTQHSEHLSVKAVCELLLVEPPKHNPIFSPALPPTAA